MYANTTLTSATILGTGSYLPGPSISNAELGRQLGRHVIWLAEMLGAGYRHFAIDLATGKLRPGISNAEMATQAARQALDNARVEPDEVDLLVLATSTPDYPFPGTAFFVQEQLGIRDCAVVELRAGCGGMAQAFSIAGSLIQTGSAQTAVLIGSELISPFLFSLYDPVDRWDKAFLASISMFGDGAGAAVLRRSRSDEIVMSCMFRSMSTGRPPGLLLRVGGALNPRSSNQGPDGAQEPLHHDPKAIQRETPAMIRAALDWLQREVGIDNKDVDYVIPPQANNRLMKSVSKELGVPLRKVFSNFERVGNTASASIYVALDELNRTGRLKPGMRVVLLPAEATKWAYGAIALHWEN